MQGAISSFLRPSFLSSVSYRPHHFCSLVSSYSSSSLRHFCSSISSSSSSPETKLFHSTSENSSLVPVNPVSFAKNVTAEAQLHSIILKEIKKEKSNESGDPPKEFPFEIINSMGKQSITFKRNFMCERIEIKVRKLDLSETKEEKESSTELNIPLLVRLSRPHGTSLEFYCIASSTNITIDQMQLVKPSDGSSEEESDEPSDGSSDEESDEPSDGSSDEESDESSDEEPLVILGPKFVDLNEKFRHAFYNYLKVRGIDGSFAIFLHDYIERDGIEYLEWLRGTKDFISKCGMYRHFAVCDTESDVY
ncbi:uncharacterized protein At2g39795, mitochondrial-like [Tasmannia lanceolata]|uniref:uncharacterized protein At2g39795, mitochondrial-like n=1 Tax=Tasmannia lanceolata TaxID=3420 RepID=UPI004063113D